MRIRLPTKSKSNNYTESCMINEADGWRGRNVWYLGRSVRNDRLWQKTLKTMAVRKEIMRNMKGM